ncbi:unnamed protein product [Didymodactylos carnosus]|nr:unnamed protein product [Didymodactylos carnosus]
MKQFKLSEIPNIKLLTCTNAVSNKDHLNALNTHSSYVSFNDILLYIHDLTFETGMKVANENTIGNICHDCVSSLKKAKLPKFSAGNKMWIGDVPDELKVLSIAELKLISVYRHSRCVAKFVTKKSRDPSTQQSKTQGNVITFPQDVPEIVRKLPLSLNDLCDSIKIIFVGENPPEKKEFAVFRVRKQKVLSALKWLKKYNPFYEDVNIDMDNVGQLPEDDVPVSLLQTMHVTTDVQAATTERSSYVPDLPSATSDDDEEDDSVPLLGSGVVDTDGTNVSAKDINDHILKLTSKFNKQSLNDPQTCTANNEYYIRRGSKPVNEYYNPNLLMGLFPTLFPYGSGAVEDDTRPVKVAFKRHIQYLLTYQDRRFERHYSFMFVAFNILQKRNACFQARLLVSRPYFRQNAVQLQTLTAAEIQSALACISQNKYSAKENPRLNMLLNHIKTVGSHVMGSCQSRGSLRNEIHGLIYHSGLPDIFITINPADIHSPVAMYFAGVNLDLDKILDDNYPQSSYKRAQICAKNPVAIARFFHKLISTIIETTIKGGALGPVITYYGTIENQGRGSLHIHMLVWLDHDLTPALMREKVNDVAFRQGLIEYLEDIIKEDFDDFKKLDSSSEESIE